MRWKKLSDWGEARLRADEWAPLTAEITAPDLEAVEQCVEELTGCMEHFRTTIDGAPLPAEITAPELEAVEQGVEELAGCMEYFRTTIDGAPLTGVSDGQRAVSHSVGTDTWGQQVLRVTFYAGGPVGVASPDAFQRLGRAAGSLTDELQAEGIRVDGIRWSERPYVKRPF